VLESAAALAATWVGLRLAGFRRWGEVLAWASPVGDPTTKSGLEDELNRARKITRMAEAAARHHLFGFNCLEQSLVLWWLLRLRGLSAELRVGGWKEGERFEAHAWVELGGTVLSGGGAGHMHFVPFDGPLTKMETPIR